MPTSLQTCCEAQTLDTFSWLIQNPQRADLAIKDQIRNDFHTSLCKWFFFYFHIYITRCPLTGPNSKVAPFCILRTQKSRYCTFTKAPCFCKSRYDNNHKANESKGMVMSVSSAQTSLLTNSTALHTSSTCGNFLFWGWD